MKITPNLRFRVFVLCFHLITAAFEVAAEDRSDDRKPYIVYMGEAISGAQTNALEHHHNLLVTAIGDENKAKAVKIHSYGKSINGFAARLLPHEAEKLSREEGVVSVFESTRRQLHTTRSWDFLGMKEAKYQRRIHIESNIIVGILDTGIYMESPSFNDKGFGPPPTRWKGKCVTGPNLTRCNNKVIGAKYFRLEYPYPRENISFSAADDDGHGTHTTSTVAGLSVTSASFFGIANGTARGGVPAARIAAYKVCWEDGCSDTDLLAAFDEAISDGVDIISISIGGAPTPFFQDPIAIGAFHAMKKGILTSSSAGNSGPDLFTVANSAPWLMTVAASSVDRKFETLVKLGNGLSAPGISLNTFSPKKKLYPLTSGLLASNISEGEYGNPSVCDYGTMGEEKVKGRIVYCEDGSSGQDDTIKNLKGVGVIIMQIDEPSDIASATLIAATFVSFHHATSIAHYINSTKNPKAVIHKTRVLKMKAPSVASFSSRGPQQISPNILKPDLSAPGLNILAAYSKLASITGYSNDKRRTLYNILSGTSMACPHATAAAAYVKSFHPNWSPAAIKSALMTTATPMRVKGKEAELSYGSGQINPRSAVHPGLVYDNSILSYIRYLCKEGYNNTMISLLVGGKIKYNCKEFKHGLGTDGLNYPSMHKQLKSTETKVNAVFYRTVRNVGFGNSIYVAKVTAPKGLRIEVIPRILRFKRRGESRSFKVVVNGVWVKKKTDGVMSAALQWNDSRGHVVTSPILLFKLD